jgi:putative membrane protein
MSRIASRRTVWRLALAALTIAALVEAVRSFAPDAAAGSTLITEHLGLTGFAIYLAYTLGVLALCGAAWWATAGEPARRLGWFVWGRMVREAVADLLPFSQVGGVVIGAAVVAARGIPIVAVYAAFIADLITELASQLLFTACGITILWVGLEAQDLRALPVAAIVAGLGATTVLLAGLIAAPVTLAAARRVAQRLVPSAARLVVDGSDALRTIYAAPRRLVAAFAFNLGAWFASAAGAWLVLHLMRVDASLGRVVALESLIFLLRSAAFAIPGGIGVQEAGYALLGPLLGLPADAVFALALAKRLRDLAIGVPILVVWQTRWTGGALGGRAEADNARRVSHSV